MTVRIYFWRAVLLFTVLLLIWLSVAAGLGGFFAQRVERGDEAAVDPLIGWQPGHPEGLFKKALTLRDRDAAAAAVLLGRAYRANAADPRPLIALAGWLGEEAQWERSDALFAVVERLAPVDPQVQMTVAKHWAVRGRFDLVLRHLSTVLEADSARQAVLFPALLQMADAPEQRQLFTPLLRSPPAWWTQFFGYLCAQALDQETPRYFYNLRRATNSAPLMPEERAAYVWRLQRDGMIAEAYVVWIGGLDSRERDKLGLLFDGGFELPLEYPGFGWHVASDKHFAAKLATTQGAIGSKALGLQFRGFEGYFNGLSQALLLDPGVYRLTGRARPDGLVSKGGLRWQVHCLLPKVELLGEGSRFLGSMPWSDFDLRFEVPPACQYQQLSLVSAGEHAFEYPLDGSLWFDDLKIVRVLELDAAARASGLLRRKGSDR